MLCGCLKEPGFFASTLASADPRISPSPSALFSSFSSSSSSSSSSSFSSSSHRENHYREATVCICNRREEKRVQGERLIERREPGHHHRGYHRLLQLLDAEIHRDNLIHLGDFGQRNPMGLVN